jgi:hypothetical protein
MGLVNFGAPDREIHFIKSAMNLDVFVEGGTFKGGTAQKLSNLFSSVFTIEKSDIMFDVAKKNIGHIKNINMLKGDTRKHLDEILSTNDNILFWLDAHWSGGDTYGEEDECPLIEELQIIFRHSKNHVILIDDARLFLAPPPLPHKHRNWPSLKEIINTVPGDRQITVFDDVIYIYKDSDSCALTDFLQREVTERWRNNKNNDASVLSGLKIVLKGLAKGNFWNA